MRVLILAAALAQAATGDATVAKAPAPAPITDPQWEPIRATFQELGRYYPKAALDQGLDGVAILQCAVTAAGGLSDCIVFAEAPDGQGFGTAAVSMAPLFRMSSATRSGTPVVGRPVKLAVRFRLPWSPADASDNVALATVTPWVWQSLPKAEDIARVFPSSAVRRGVEGRAALHCQISAEGLLIDCTVAEEMPAGEHFGDAALKLAPLFRVHTGNGAGVKAPGKEITIPIRFQLPRA